MILALQNKLEDSLLEIFASHKNMSVKQITLLLKKMGKSSTEQGIYRVLRKLQKDGIIVKLKNQYNIRIPWLLEVSALMEKMEYTYLAGEYFHELVPKGKEKYVWKFSNIFKMCNFWSELLIAVAKNTKSKNKTALNYSPHLWYVLIQKEQENQFINSYLSEIEKSYMIIGSRSPLDKHSLTLFAPQNPKEQRYLASEQEYIEKKRSTYIDVIDDYIIHTSFDKVTTNAIEKFYQENTLEQLGDGPAFHHIWMRRIKGKITVQKNKAKARTYSKKFQKIFGPLS